MGDRLMTRNQSSRNVLQFVGSQVARILVYNNPNLIYNDIFVVLYPNIDQKHEENHVCMGVLWSEHDRPLPIRFVNCAISHIILCFN